MNWKIVLQVINCGWSGSLVNNRNLLIYQMILPHIPVLKNLLKPHSREHRLRYCHHFIPFTLAITAETFSFLSKKQTPFCPTLQTNITLVQVWQEESPSLQSENKLIFIIMAFDSVLLFIYPSLSSHLPSFIILPINLSFKTLSHTLHPVKHMVCLFTHPVLICLTLMISHNKAEHRSPPYLLCTVPSGLPFPSPVHESEKWNEVTHSCRLLATPWTVAY